MAKITPQALAVLSRIKRYGLDTWLPGKVVISKLHDSSFTRANAQIISDLISTGYLAVDYFGAITAGLAGEHELAHRPSNINESQMAIAGHRFQVVTKDWSVEADAAQVRHLVLGGLSFLAETDPPQFARIRQRTHDGRDDEALETIVVSAVSLVTARYSDQFTGREHRVGVRVLDH